MLPRPSPSPSPPPQVVPFSVKQRTEFVWGGCMLFRAAEMRGDARGILAVSQARGAGPGGAGRRRLLSGPGTCLHVPARRQHHPAAAKSASPAFRPSSLTRSDRPTAHQAWEDGGYSDDLTVASQCTEQGLVIYCPSYAIFPQW